MNANAVFESVQMRMANMPLSWLWRGYGSAIFLEFGLLTPRGQRRDGSERSPTGEISIGIEWSWRIENESSILCGSWSDDDKWDDVFDLLRNQPLRHLRRFGRLPEIDLEFANRHHLLSFQTSDGQPAPGSSLIDANRQK